MASSPFPGIQTLIDDYVQKIDEQYGIQMGVVIGVVTPDYPAGDILFSTGPMITRGGAEFTPGLTTPFELGSVSKVFTAGIYQQLQGDFSVTIGSMLGPALTMSPVVAAVTLQELAAYSSGFPQDNGYCTLHPFQWPAGTTSCLSNLFNYLQNWTAQPYTPSKTYAYSNLAMAMVGMAALKLQSVDDQDYVNSYNTALIDYCQLYGVDTDPSSPTTLVYYLADTSTLPVGFDSSYSAAIGAPVPMPEIGSGGIVSTPNDMLQFLLYVMSSSYPSNLQQTVWTLPDYCVANTNTTLTLGWFVDAAQMNGQTIVSKDGGVAGFTSWIANTQKNSSGVSDYGIFVLTNGPDATTLGRQAFAGIIPSSLKQTVLNIPRRSF